MYLLNMVIILCVLYNNVITAISYIRTYYVSTSGSTLDTVVETMLSTTTRNDGASRPKKKKAKLMCLGVTTTARYVQPHLVIFKSLEQARIEFWDRVSYYSKMSGIAL
jgi:hypothetical protein